MNELIHPVPDKHLKHIGDMTVSFAMLELRIPIHSGHPFRFIPDSDSNPFRTPIPIHFGHPFQSNPDSSFGLFGLSDLETSEASGSSIFETLDN